MPREQHARERWVDVAKGGAIVLVVLYHSSLFLQDVGLASLWSAAGTALNTFRMPLFFFTAGLFAARTLSLDLRSLLRRRVLTLVWLYVVWSLVWTLAFQVLPLLREVPTWGELFLLLVWPNPSTWFVYALALYFLAAWCVRGLPVGAQLGLAGAVSVLFGTGAVDTGSTALDKMGTYFVFFLAAASFGPALRGAAQRVRLGHLVTAAAGYLAVMLGAAAVDGALDLPGVRLAVSCLAVVLGVAVAVLLTGRPAFRWLELLGTRTLPIYVLHYYPILVLCAVLEPVAAKLKPAAPVLPPILTAGAIAVALLVERATRRVPGLYALPTVVQRYVGTAAGRGRARDPSGEQEPVT